MGKNVFISWSGPLSHKVARVLYEWLPGVIQSIEPFISSEDIQKGTPWFNEMSNELGQISFGVICVTPDSLNSPWLLFEAGALSKGAGESRVTPLLVGVSNSDLSGPLAQFNSTSTSKEDFKRLVKTINVHLGEKGITEERLNETFENAWPALERQIHELLEDAGSFTEQATGKPLSGIRAKLLPKEEVAFQYMAESILRAKSRIDHAALAPPIRRLQAPSKIWEEAIEKVLRSNKVTYCYVAQLTDDARLKRVEKHWPDPQIQHYFVKYYEPAESAVPALSFILIDEREVVMHYPFEPGQEETFLAIEHPDIARLFVAYYKRIWDQAKWWESDTGRAS